MRQTKNRGNSKIGFFSWIAKYTCDLSDSFQTYCVQYLAARKREDETFVLVLNRAYILKRN